MPYNIYVSPCNGCEYNYYTVDEFGDCEEDICQCPDKEQLCPFVQWAKGESR